MTLDKRASCYKTVQISISNGAKGNAVASAFARTVFHLPPQSLAYIASSLNTIESSLLRGSSSGWSLFLASLAQSPAALAADHSSAS